MKEGLKRSVVAIVSTGRLSNGESSAVVARDPFTRTCRAAAGADAVCSPLPHDLTSSSNKEIVTESQLLPNRAFRTPFSQRPDISA